MVSYKFTALAQQVTKRRLNHLHRYQRVGKNIPRPKSRAPVAQGSAQLGIFEEKPDLEVFHQYDPDSREVEWAFYSSDGCFLLQFGFSLQDRSYQIYSLHAALFHEQAEMKKYLAAINANLSGHYPALRLVCSPAKGPEIQVV